MSIASKRTKKEKKLKREGMKIPAKCSHCNVPVGNEIYQMERPWDYKCKMCGEYAFEELRNIILKNENFNLAKEVANLDNEENI